MRLLIVCLIKNESLNFHHTLTNELLHNFNVKPQKLPGHFTIKAPFEIENETYLEELTTLTESYVKNNNKALMKMEGFDHFNNKVIYIPITPSAEALKLHDNFIDELKNFSWLPFKKNDGKGKIFHCTIATKITPIQYNEVWNYIKKYTPNFNIYIDNITIMKWGKFNRWEVYKSYILQ